MKRRLILGLLALSLSGACTTPLATSKQAQENPAQNGILKIGEQGWERDTTASSPTVTLDVPDVSGIKTEIIQFMPPSALRANEPLTSLLYTPEDGTNSYNPGVVLIHGGLAGHPARQVGAPRFAAERLAAKGFTVISPMTRHSRDEFRTKFEDIVFDIQASVDALEARGISDIILAGHSMGSVRISYYQAETQDPRVKALVHFAPTADMGGEDGIGRSFIPDYDAKVQLAQETVAGGGSDINLQGNATQAEIQNNSGIINAIGGYFYTAEAFLSHWGPEAKSRNSDIMPENTVPILMLAGGLDGAVPEGRMERLKSLSTKSPKVDYIRYPNVNHFFEEVWDQSVDDMTSWLAEIGLEIGPNVSFEVIDARMGNGRHLPGILYLPEGGADPNKPAFVLQHGWTGNIMHSSNHWLGWRLAREGYAVLAPQTRVSGPPGAMRTSLADVAADLGNWVDAMDARGFDKLIMEGHSMGGLWVSNYMSLSDDPRVIGMIYLAPTRDVPEYLRGGLGDERYEDAYARMSAAAERGEGDSAFNFEKFRVPNVDQENGPVSATLTLARTFMEYHGPDTRAYHTQRVTEFARPSLSIAGRQDLLMTDAFLEQFLSAHAGEAQVVWYENGSHGLRESKDRVLQDVVTWTKATFEDE